ncbi:A24 family peptidase [Candidatus Epulonipiscium viviparus]|uniref:prepilin peptidase n=1 Tax=Candidatus Epulonipiscium viviparus TaxID=420336 RepID=UPI00016C0DEA|nr:A24 family peptidase [Candidatus Epulopiscium viviparus]
MLEVLMCVYLICISISDAATKIIPPKFTAAIMCLGIINTAMNANNIVEHIVGMLIIPSILFLIIVFTKEQAMGGGDLKLMTGAGLYLGSSKIMIAFSTACYIALFWYAVKSIAGNPEREFAFGPYLAIGIVVAMFMR